MNRSVQIALLMPLSAAIALAFGTAHHKSKSVGRFPTHTNLPGFPFSRTDLLQYKQTQDMTAIRAHGWKLFSGLTTGKAPQWETWYTKCDLPIDNAGCENQDQARTVRPSLRQLELPIQLVLPLLNPARAQAIPAVMPLPTFFKNFIERPTMANVLMNPELARFIQSEGLNQEMTLKSLLPSPADCPSTCSVDAPAPPDSAIAVKATWEQVVPDTNVASGPRPWILHVWDPALRQLATNPDSGGEVHIADPGFRPGVVQIDLTKDLPSDCREQDYMPTDPVPIGCFHYQKLDEAEYRKVNPYMKLVNGAVIGHAPYYLVLVAVHIITRETPQWTWQTFYWSTDAVRARTSRKESVFLRSPWSHFDMDATLDANTPPDPKSGGPNICSNPFMEGTMPHGMSSNCLYCHAHATYSTTAARPTPDVIGSPAYRNGRREVDCSREQSFFAGAVKTDFLWSIADIGQGEVQKKFETQLEEFLNLRSQ